MRNVFTGRSGFALAILGAFAVGAFLRLYMLPSQILLDDEWHGPNQVIGTPFSSVLTTFDGKDNTSLPLNVYDWLLLHTAGWSEFTLRLPVVLAGLLGLVIMPLALRKIAPERTAAIFAFLLAIAPFAIFYGRFSRAYVLTMLLAYLALLSGRRWLSGGENRAGYAFLFTGTLAVYAHPLSVVAVAAPFAVYYAGTLRRTAARGGRADDGVLVRPESVRRTGIIQILLLVPIAWMMLSSPSGLPWGEGSWSLSGLEDACALLSGTASLPMNIIFYVLLLRGAVALFRRDPLLARIHLATFLLYAAALAVSRPFGLDTGVVVLRYMIVMVPVALSTVAAGIDSLPGSREGEKHRGGIVAIPAAVLLTAGLLVSGPLRWIYEAPNNFTNHSAYQGSYEPLPPDSSDARHVYPGFSVRRRDVPEFYRRLREMPEVETVVEYPFDVTNYNNLFYFYQRVHGKRVVAGYITDREILGHRAEVPPGDEQIPLRLGMLSADRILSHAEDPRALKFRNMVDVTDPRALARSGAEVLIIHKYVMALRFLPGGHDAIPVRYRSAVAIARMSRGVFGPPVYEDDEIICFRIGKV